MPSAFALAGVTAVLKDLLNDGIADHDLSAIGNVMVTALPPDRIPVTAADERSQINLFLFQAAPNAALRNAALPSRSATGERLTNPPLALDLRYLVTAYGKEEFHADALLGFAMQVLHENPLLTRAMINATLKPALPVGVTLPPGLQMLSTSDLGEQIESIKIVPASLDTEEMSRLWAAMQAKYRPTAAYTVSVVLIESTRAAKVPLPVLQQGDSGRGPSAGADLVPAIPTITEVVLPNGRTQALLGDVIRLTGHDLAGPTGAPADVVVTARLVNLRTGTNREIAVPVNARSASTLQFTLPALPAEIPAGVYGLSLAVVPAADPADVRTTNDMPLAVSPVIAGGLGAIARTAVDPVTDLGTADFAITCSPEVLPTQRATLIVGAREIPAQDHPAQGNTLQFVAAGMAQGTYRVRLRIDGIDSLLVDMSDPAAPVFDASQSVDLT
jgi:hypothetical protein